MHLNSINRFQAFTGHLIASACVASLLSLIVFLLWYPGTLAYASGVINIFLLLLIVDVTLGPSITLIIFNTKKKELKRDLSIIVVIQLAALLYGMYTVFITRPVYMVYNARGFDIVYANEISQKNLDAAKPSKYSSLPYLGPKLVSASLPSNPIIAKKIITTALYGGDDVQNMPQYYSQYEDLKQRILINTLPLENLKEPNKKRENEIQLITERYSKVGIDIGYLPITAKAHDVTAIINKETLEILEISSLNPL